MFNKLVKIYIGIFIFSVAFIWKAPKPKKYTEPILDPIPEEELEVTMTVYNPVSSQTDSTPLITADNSTISLEKLKSGELKWIAISRDLLETFSFGEKIVIPSGRHGLGGVYEIHDLMNSRFTKRIDVLVYSGMGKYEGIKIKRYEYEKF